MIAIMRVLWWILGMRFKSRALIEAKNLALRHQLNIVFLSAPRGGRLRISN